jgi:hypothetical protein
VINGPIHKQEDPINNITIDLALLRAKGTRVENSAEMDDLSEAEWQRFKPPPKTPQKPKTPTRGQINACLLLGPDVNCETGEKRGRIPLSSPYVVEADENDDTEVNPSPTPGPKRRRATRGGRGKGGKGGQ